MKLKRYNGTEIEVQEFKDTGWISLNSEVKYRKVNNIVYVSGVSTGTTALKQNDYTKVAVLPKDCIPIAEITFFYGSKGGSTERNFGSIWSNTANIMLYNTKSDAKFWSYSFSYHV